MEVLQKLPIPIKFLVITKTHFRPFPLNVEFFFVFQNYTVQHRRPQHARTLTPYEHTYINPISMRVTTGVSLSRETTFKSQENPRKRCEHQDLNPGGQSPTGPSYHWTTSQSCILCSLLQQLLPKTQNTKVVIGNRENMCWI